jgi:hypothetical protein
MIELQKLLRRRKDRIRRLSGSGSVLQSLLLALVAAGGGFYFGASERGEALWDEYFGPRITWNQPIDSDEIRQRFAGGLLEGRVTRVSDGDTVHVRLNSGQKFKIRLAEIDAPESCQPYGTQSTRFLSNLDDQSRNRLICSGEMRARPSEGIDRRSRGRRKEESQSR